MGRHRFNGDGPALGWLIAARSAPKPTGLKAWLGKAGYAPHGGRRVTVHVVPVDGPRPGEGRERLAATAPVSEAEADGLIAAMATDVIRAVGESGGDLVVTHHGGDDGPDASVTDLVEAALADPSAARYQPADGSGLEAHAIALEALLEGEGTGTAAVVDPRAPTLARTHLDRAAMKLRRSGAVVAPSTRGRLAYLGLERPIEIGGASEAPELESVVDRCLAGGLAVDFLEVHPVVETGDDLLSLVCLVRARAAADRIVPHATAGAIADLGLVVTERDGERTLERR